MLTFVEFAQQANSGDIFQFFPDRDTDFSGNQAIKDLQGKRCKVFYAYQQDGWSHPKTLEWTVGFDAEDIAGGNKWCFYETNDGVSRAVFRILEPAPLVEIAPLVELPEWEMDLYEESQMNKAMEAFVVLKAKMELLASEKIIQEKIKKWGGY